MDHHLTSVFKEALRDSPYARAAIHAHKVGGKLHATLPIVMETRKEREWRDEFVTRHHLRLYCADGLLCESVVEVHPRWEHEVEAMLSSALSSLVAMAAARREDDEKPRPWGELWIAPADVSYPISTFLEPR